MRRPGIEPGSTAWKAAMLTTIPPTPVGMRMAAKEKVDEWDEDWMENKEREDEEGVMMTQMSNTWFNIL